MSERISFTCPGCQKKLAATVRQVGRTGPCPACGQRVIVPAFAPQEQGPVLVPFEEQTESQTHFAVHG
jgi:DNA-directed RNA polymerase subunit RPC12/RpoP